MLMRFKIQLFLSVMLLTLTALAFIMTCTCWNSKHWFWLPKCKWLHMIHCLFHCCETCSQQQCSTRCFRTFAATASTRFHGWSNLFCFFALSCRKGVAKGCWSCHCHVLRMNPQIIEIFSCWACEMMCSHVSFTFRMGKENNEWKTVDSEDMQTKEMTTEVQKKRKQGNWGTTDCCPRPVAKLETVFDCCNDECNSQQTSLW